jgi:hypothetical protein
MSNRAAISPSGPKSKTSLRKFGRRVKPHLRTIESWPLSGQETTDRFRAYHEIGRELLKLNRSRAYSLAELKEVLGRGRRWQLEVRRFAEQYDEQQLQELCQQADVINWKHLRLLLWMPAQKRQKWLAVCHKNRWTADRFRRELKRRRIMGAWGGARGGRPVGGSRKRPEVQLWHLMQLTDDWTELAQEVLKGRRNQAQLEFQDFDAAFWENLAQARKSTSRFQKSCEKVRDQLDRALATAVRQKAAEAEE